MNPKQWRTTILLLAAITLAAFLPVLQNQFVNFDDDVYVYQNTHVKQGLTFQGAQWALTTGEASNWHPLTWMSLMLDVQLWGVNPHVMHAMNLLWHLANVILVWIVMVRLFGQGWCAVVVALLFAIHPTRVESVAWISERKDLLCVFFGLWSIFFYIRYTETLRSRMYLLMLGTFVLSLLAKPMLVTLPFLLLLLDFWPLDRAKNNLGHRKMAHLLWEKWPLLLLSIASSVIVVLVQHAENAVISLEKWSLHDRLANVLVSYQSYLWEIFWPFDLAVYYPLPHHISTGLVVAAVLTLTLITIFCIYFAKRQRYTPLIGWCWFLGTLTPVIGFVQVGDASHADRYTYFPAIGLFIIVAWVAKQAVKYITQQKVLHQVNRQTKRYIIYIISLSIVFSCAVLTWRQCFVWRNSFTLWQRAIDVTENNYLAHHNLATAWAKERQNIPKAIAHFEIASQMNPDFWKSSYNLAKLKSAVHDWRNAATAYQNVLRLEPNRFEVQIDLAHTFVKLGKIPQAIELFKQVASERPKLTIVSYNIGALLLKLGRPNEAMPWLLKATRTRPNDAFGYFALGETYLKQKQLTEAKKCFEKVLALSPSHHKAAIYLKALSRHKPSTPTSKKNNVPPSTQSSTQSSTSSSTQSNTPLSIQPSLIHKNKK